MRLISEIYHASVVRCFYLCLVEKVTWPRRKCYIDYSVFQMSNFKHNKTTTAHAIGKQSHSIQQYIFLRKYIRYVTKENNILSTVVFNGYIYISKFLFVHYLF
jgi:hypothetical protein